MQIHLLFLPLCLALSITWHAKRTLFSWQMQKGNDLLLIYLFTLHVSPSSPPPLISITVHRGGFFYFLHENNVISFLASPAKQAPAAHSNRWPPIITEYLIDPGRAVCVCEREIVRGCLTSVMHVMCSGPRCMHSPSPPWCLSAPQPWGSLDEWLSHHICTLPPDT